MNTIWKYKIDVVGTQKINMPLDAEILSVQVQKNSPCLWARVDPDAVLVGRLFITHGTGHVVPETTGDHIGTYQLDDGDSVMHVFEARGQKE